MLKRLCAVLLLAGVGAAAAAPGDDAYERALDEYNAGHYREATTALREAAQAGHGEAAHMLGTMLIIGRQLYGDQVASDTAEGLRWLHASASAGNGTARFRVD